jgi:ABC-2 type transport system ATP-binding protein
MTATVEARHIVKRHGSVLAVDDLSFDASAGEILGVLGPNGAGKTTAIRVLTTILAPTHGTFTVAGVPHTRPADIRRRIGVLPESAGYPEHQTGEEFLRYHARLHGHSARSAAAVAAAALEELGLADRARSPVRTYSRGMRQRLGIARALVNEPEVVFLDEPTLGLDPAGQRKMLSLIRAIAQDRGATVLLSTHLLADVEETCSRVLILNRGRMVALGTVADVARRAAAPRTATVRVASQDSERTLGALRDFAVERRPGAIVIALDGAAPNDALRALVAAGVPVQAYEVEAATLSDAFLTMTEPTL